MDWKDREVRYRKLDAFPLQLFAEIKRPQDTLFREICQNFACFSSGTFAVEPSSLLLFKQNAESAFQKELTT